MGIRNFVTGKTHSLEFTSLETSLIPAIYFCQQSPLLMSMFKIESYQHPINFDGQELSLHFFPDRKELIGKTITITLSANKKDQIAVDDENIISRHTQPVYARRTEEIFAKIVQINRGYSMKVEIIGSPLSTNDSCIIFYIHDTKSTAYLTHSQYISKIITDNVTMESDLVAYFKSIDYENDLEKFADIDTSWIDQSFLDRIDKSPMKNDIDALNDLLRKKIIDQETHNQYINHYIPLNNIYQTIVDILGAGRYTKHVVDPYDPEFHEREDCISTSVTSYGYGNDNKESRYYTRGEVVDMNIQNIHYIPLDLNHLSDLKKFKYEFG